MLQSKDSNGLIRPSSLVLVLSTLSLFGCGQPTTPAARQGGWLLVTVTSARIAPTNDDEPWDGREPTDEDFSSALALRSLARILGMDPESMVLRELFSALSAFARGGTDSEAMAHLPDPYVEIGMPEGVVVRRWASGVVRNSLEPQWDESFFVRPADLGGSGVSLVVYDLEGNRAERTRVGSVTLPRETLLDALRESTSRELVLRGESLSELRVTLTNPSPARASRSTVRAPLRSGLVRSGVIVPRRAVVRVRVSGSGTVGQWACTGPVGPAGHTSPDCRSYNLAVSGASGAPHGTPVVLIGRDPEIHAFPVTATTDGATGAGMFVAPAAGELIVGVNDRDPGNDDGDYVFELEVNAP